VAGKAPVGKKKGKAELAPPAPAVAAKAAPAKGAHKDAPKPAIVAKPAKPAKKAQPKKNSSSSKNSRVKKVAKKH
jgi:hypothetical protein